MTTSTCLMPVWLDGIYRARCSMGTAGRCAKHGSHRPHSTDDRICDLMEDGYCRTHGVYVAAHPGQGANEPAAVVADPADTTR